MRALHALVQLLVRATQLLALRARSLEILHLGPEESDLLHELLRARHVPEGVRLDGVRHGARLFLFPQRARAHGLRIQPGAATHRPADEPRSPIDGRCYTCTRCVETGKVRVPMHARLQPTRLTVITSRIERKHANQSARGARAQASPALPVIASRVRAKPGRGFPNDDILYDDHLADTIYCACAGAALS